MANSTLLTISSGSLYYLFNGDDYKTQYMQFSVEGIYSGNLTIQQNLAGDPTATNLFYTSYATNATILGGTGITGSWPNATSFQGFCRCDVRAILLSASFYSGSVNVYYNATTGL